MAKTLCNCIGFKGRYCASGKNQNQFGFMLVLKPLINNTDIPSWASALLVVKSLDYHLLTIYTESSCGVGLWDSGVHESDGGLWTPLSSSLLYPCLCYTTTDNAMVKKEHFLQRTSDEIVLQVQLFCSVLKILEKRTLKWGNTEPDDKGH